MAKIGTGTVSVGSAAGAGNSINGLDGIGNVQTNITTKESTFMGGNPARRLAVGAKCMPGQVQKTIDGNLTGSAYRYSGTPSTDAWKQTAMSEFKNAYNTVPSINPAYTQAGTGTTSQGNITLTCTPPADAPSPCMVYISPVPASGETTWVSCNVSNQKTYTLTRGVAYTAYVKDVNNCGANLEISLGNIQYTL